MEDFLLRNKGGREAGALIVRESVSLEAVLNHITERGFLFANTPMKFLDALKAGGAISVTFDKINRDPARYFDIIQGFASGSVDAEGVHITPAYDDLNVILVLSETFIESELEAGRDWMSLCGLAFQYSDT